MNSGRYLLRDQVDEIEQHGKAGACQGETREQPGTPAALCGGECMDEQHGFRAFAKYRQERQSPDRPRGFLRQCVVGLVCEVVLPTARVLLHHQPAADVEHQAGGDQDDDPFHDIVVPIGIEHR